MAKKRFPAFKTWIRIAMEFIFISIWLTAIANASSEPVIFYTDIISGPATGGENNQGCYLTINGKRFRSAQRDSIVTIGGGEVARYIKWSDEEISVQLGENVQSGAISVITRNGTAVGPENFTVRDGDFYFVSLTGNDSTGVVNDIAKPYRTPWYVENIDGFGAGDFIVVRGGTYDLSNPDEKLHYSRWMTVAPNNMSGTSTHPITVYGYPGEVPRIWWGTASGVVYYGVVASYSCRFWNFANLFFDLEDGAGCAMRLGFHTHLDEYLENARLVNITVRGGMVDNDTVNLMALHRVNGLKMYGLDIGFQSEQTPENNASHMIYLKQQYANADIGWCYIHDNAYGRAAMQIYGDRASNENNTNVRVHDCRFENLPGEAVLLGIGAKEVYFYNNIVDNCLTKKTYGFGAVYLQGAILRGTLSTDTPSGKYYLYNNTFYTDANEGGIIRIGFGNNGLLPEQITMYNNIIHPKGQSTMYYKITNSDFDPDIQITADNNLWHNSNQAIPAWAGQNAINTSPYFVAKDSGDFHLQHDNPNPIHNSGRQIDLPRNDMDGFSLPQGRGYSIGAYEVLEGGPTPFSPTNLSVE